MCFFSTHLDVKDDLGTSGEVILALSDGEGTSGGRFPAVELVVVVLGDDLDFVGHQEGRVETHTELTDHGNVCSSLYT